MELQKEIFYSVYRCKVKCLDPVSHDKEERFVRIKATSAKDAFNQANNSVDSGDILSVTSYPILYY